jgi:glycosyltransferase involved in cell wall biosynthesis
LRILISHAIYPPDFAGGGEYVVHELAKKLAARGASVRVITAGDPRQDEVDGIPVRRLPISKYRFNFAARAIAREARDADIIQTFNYHACLPSWVAGKISKRPVVCGMLGLFGSEWRVLRGPVAGSVWQLWERLLLHVPYDSVLFYSEFSRRSPAGSLVRDERAVVCPPGISIKNYYVGEKQDEVLFVGKFEQRKGIDTVIEIARRLPAIRFRVIGWGDRAESVLESAPPNVTVEPFERGQVMYDAFARARVFLFPSRAETFGLALAEAMASGCAIVSSVPLGFEGELVTQNDVGHMTSAVERLMGDRALSDRLGRQNARLASAYTWDRHVDTVWAVYERLLRGESPSLGRERVSERG